MQISPAPSARSAASFKNRSFRERLGFARAGIAIVFRRERSFRTQCLFALAAAGVAAGMQLGALWAAVVALSIGLVLALELANAALEYLIDCVHPDYAEEIGRAKDAAAGAVLAGSIASLAVAGLMVADWLV